MPKLQVYGTGGLAYGGAISNTALFTLQNPGTSWTLADANYQDVLVGWTAGGGFEWAFMPNWSLKAEYLFYNLGTAYATGANALRNNYNTTNASWSNLGTLSTGATRPAGAGPTTTARHPYQVQPQPRAGRRQPTLRFIR